PGGKKAALADFYSPELATLVDRVPSGNEWLHEIKFDGYRILARIDRGRVKLFTREAHDWTARFENCAAALAQLPVRQAFLDGEIAALREDGSSDFQLLQNSLRAGAPARIVYFIFDLLYLDGADLRAAPLQKRKQALQKILEGAPENLRYSEHWIGRGAALYEKAGAAATGSRSNACAARNSSSPALPIPPARAPISARSCSVFTALTASCATPAGSAPASAPPACASSARA